MSTGSIYARLVAELVAAISRAIADDLSADHIAAALSKMTELVESDWGDIEAEWRERK